MEILAIAGSLRLASSNVALVHAIAKLAPQNMTVNLYSGLGNLPHFSPDIDTEDPPASVQQWRQQVKDADAVFICTPEYAYGMPGSLKNALDWLVSSGDLYHKPVAALSASPYEGGGDRALAWLCQTLTAQNAIVPPEATFPVPFVRKQLSDDTITDPQMVKQLLLMFEALKKAASSDV
ncbi:MAG: NAD(P)H-dependent oxidoreductase [Cyanobacteria bacterium P01_F01_bin.53]